MKHLAFLIAFATPMTVVMGQNSAARPTIAILVTATDVKPGDSAAVSNALRRGLQIDSVVELLERPPTPGQPLRGANYFVTTLVRPAGDTLAVHLRVFNVLTSRIVASETASSAAGNLTDSLTAIGRRIARTVAAGKP